MNQSRIRQRQQTCFYLSRMLSLKLSWRRFIKVWWVISAENTWIGSWNVARIQEKCNCIHFWHFTMNLQMWANAREASVFFNHIRPSLNLFWCTHTLCAVGDDRVSPCWQSSTGVVYPSIFFFQPLSNHLLSTESTRKGCRPARAAATLSASVPKVSQVYQKCWSVLIREQQCWGCS